MLRKVFLLALLSLAPLSASVIYNLTSGAAGFQYTAPDFITSQITVGAGSLDSCNDPYTAGTTCVSVEFTPNVAALGDLAEVDWTENVPGLGTAIDSFDYSPGTLGKTGVFHAINNDGVLTITQVSSVPEPRLLWLLLPLCLLVVWRNQRPPLARVQQREAL